MITLATDEPIYLVTEAEKTHLYAEAYKQGQIDMKELMEALLINKEGTL